MVDPDTVRTRRVEGGGTVVLVMVSDSGCGCGCGCTGTFVSILAVTPLRRDDDDEDGEEGGEGEEKRALLMGGARIGATFSASLSRSVLWTR